ncbi:MAG: hypothetical protein QXT63_02135 [Thermoplasmata archaeon]
MKCYIHKEKDAIGACVSCGKGLCEDCKIEFDRKLHCKACIEKKSITHEQFYPPYPQSYGFPYYPYPQPYPYPYPIWSPSYKPPMPKGKSKKIFFNIGGIGALISAIVSGISGFLYLYYIIEYGYDDYRNFLLIVSFALLISISVTSVGFYGYYWNYGRDSGLICCILMIISGLVYAILSLVTSLFYYIIMLYFIVGFIMLGIACGTMAWANIDSRDMFDLKASLNITVILLGICALLFWMIFPMLLGLGWFVLTAAFLFQALLFSRANIVTFSGDENQR